MKSFTEKVAEHNLSTWFLLPLIQLNKFSFGGANFVESYVNAAGTVLSVEVIDLRLCDSFQGHPEYIGEGNAEKHSFIFFELPGRWSTDFDKFKIGKYSELSDEAKQFIYAYSGLKYNAVDEGSGQSITDARLMALEKSDILRKKWEDELGVYVGKYKKPARLDINQELLSIPSSKTFMEFEQ